MRIPNYNSFEEKRRFFQPIENNETFWKIDDAKTLNSFFNSLQEDKNIYRGVNEAKYKQYTSLQRCYIEGKIHHSISVSQFITNEIENLKQDENNTVSLLQKYYNSLSFRQSDYLYLSFLQHYGSPTPLLDFSHKLEVAAYFASEDLQYAGGDNEIDDYCSIYWINMEEKENGTRNQIKNLAERLTRDLFEKLRSSENDKKEDKYHKGLKHKIIERLNSYLKLNIENLKDGVFYISNHPQESLSKIEDRIRRLSAREIENSQETTKSSKPFLYIKSFFEYYTCITNLNQIAQDGCFLLYLLEDYKAPIEEQLKGTKIYCANIHKSLVQKLRNKSNYTKKDLFPIPQCIANDAYQRSIKYI